MEALTHSRQSTLIFSVSLKNCLPVFLNELKTVMNGESRLMICSFRLKLCCIVILLSSWEPFGDDELCLEIPDEVDEPLNQQIISQLNNSQKLYYTRQIRKDFFNKCEPI